MSKKLIICCDGTGSEIEENESNVLKFYRVLKESDAQVAFYDPGVGTISNTGSWDTVKNKIKSFLGLAIGYGLDKDILEAYRFIVKNHTEGDDVYLFGFSRGAHTIRALAGIINLIGILHPHQEHLVPYILTTYKQSSRKNDYEIAWRAQEALDTKRSTIRFMGCWDTVNSVIVPRPDRFYLPTLEILPDTDKNACVQVFRHAIAIDERRRMFRLARWVEPQLYKTNPFVADEKAEEQDIKQVWFAGAHADIGGGYSEQESGAAKYPLGWMVDEAREHGLIFRETMVKRLIKGQTPKNTKKGSKRDYSPPSPTAKLHDSMTKRWKLFELFPKQKKYHSNPAIRKDTGFYIPNSEMRYIPPNATIHPSVYKRMAAEDYNPLNLPPTLTDPALTDPALTDPALTDPALTDQALTKKDE